MTDTKPGVGLDAFEMDNRVFNLETAALLLHNTELSSLSRTILRRIAEYRIDLQERDKAEKEAAAL